MLNRKRAVPLKPTPPPFRNHGNYVVSRRRAQPLAGRAGRGGRRLRAVRDRSAQAAGRGRRGRRRPHGRQGPRQAGRGEGQLRARRRRDRQGDRARRGLLGPPDRRGAQGPRARRRRPAGLGARRQGGVGGRPAARPRDPHARLAAAPAGEVQGVRRLVDLPDEPRGRDADASRSASSSGSTTPTRACRSTTCCRSSSCTRSCGKILEGGKRVAWGAKAIPEGGYWAMPRLHAPGMVICGDAGGMVNVPQAQGHPLRDPLGHARRRDDLRAAQGRLDATSRPTSRPCTTPRSARTSTSRAT